MGHLAVPAENLGVPGVPVPTSPGVSDSLEPESPHLRLAGGSNRCEGRVELQYLGRWAGVCGYTWGQREAQVVCRYLGCGTALPAPPTAAPGNAPGDTPGQVWLENVSCDGTESDLGQCRVGLWREHTCAQGDVASVACSGGCDIILTWAGDTGRRVKVAPGSEGTQMCLGSHLASSHL